MKEDASQPEKWPFAEPQPIREDQVQNAVNFLSHPKVRGTPMVQRFSFLERKGLSREEIEEAFRRCPDPPSSEAAKTVVPSEEAQSGGSHPTVVSAQPQPAQQYTSGPWASIVRARPGSHWSQLIVGAGLIAAAGVGTGYLFQKVVAPKLRAWVRDVMLEEKKETDFKEGHGKGLKPTPLEEAVGAAAVAANAAVAAANEVANSGREVPKLQAEEWQQLRSLLKTLESKTEELKSTLALMGKNSDTHEHVVAATHAHVEGTSSYKGAEQTQMEHGLQISQSTNVDRTSSNGQSTNFRSYMSQSEDEPWRHRKKADVQTHALPKQRMESILGISEEEADFDR